MGRWPEQGVKYKEIVEDLGASQRRRWQDKKERWEKIREGNNIAMKVLEGEMEKIILNDRGWSKKEEKGKRITPILESILVYFPSLLECDSSFK